MTEVVSVDDPGRRGRVIGPPRERSDGRVFQVQWNDGSKSWTPEYALENADGAEGNVFELLRSKRFGRVNDLRRNLTFIQLSGKLADVVYSMDTTNTEYLPYQYKPVLSFLESPSNGILIADEVGLGKTIEAGLIWTELRARYDARRLVVVCPAMLRDKWVLELDQKFGVEATQLDAAELMEALKANKNQMRDARAYVCSLQGLRPPSQWQQSEEANGRVRLARLLDQLIETEPSIDLLVIDEAHYLRNPETKSAEIGRMLREVSEHVVLLSATPINNRDKDLYQLLHLIDQDFFSSSDQFPQILSANEPLLRARNLALDPNADAGQIYEALRDAQSHHLLAESRQLQDVLKMAMDSGRLTETSNRVELANRIDRINLLSHVINRTRKRDVQEWRVVREPRSHFVELEGLELEFYEKVTQSIRKYAWEQEVSDGFLLCPPQRQMSSCMYAAARSWANRSSYSTDEVESLLFEDAGSIESPNGQVRPLIDHIANEVLPGLDIENLREHDAKFDGFKSVLLRYLNAYPDDKLIVFSYFRATLNYLCERLSEIGIPSQVLHGGIAENKQASIDRFRDSRKVRLLLTSEVASEGVDLQFCSLIVNYDLPWNPMKIEQRIGRIDRIGQRANKILIWNMGYANTIDERIYELLLEKLKIFEIALGGMEAVLGDHLTVLTSDLMSHQLTPEQEREYIERTYIAVENTRRQQEELEAKASHLIAHGDYILNRVRAAHEFKRRITDRDLKIYVKDYLDRYALGYEFREFDDDPHVVNLRLPAEVAVRLGEYIQSARLHGQSRLATRESIRCRFHNKIDRPTLNVETISQFHPLVRFISQDLRSRSEVFYPLIAARVSLHACKGLNPGAYALVAKRWTFTGLRTEEMIQARAIRLDEPERLLDSDQAWNLLNAIKVQGSDWLSAQAEVPIEQVEDAFDNCNVEIRRDFELTKRLRDNENQDRVNFQRNTLIRHRDRLLEGQRELLDRYRTEGRDHLVPMTEGKIRKIESRYELQLARLRQQENIRPFEADVCYGVVQLQDQDGY